MSTVQLDSTITLSFNVINREQTTAWYKKHFGFEEIYSMDEIGWSELTTNTKGVTIGLGDSEEVKPGGMVPVFGTPDIEAARKGLEAEGIKFDGDTMHVEGMVKIATFYDPDGNAIMLAQDLTL